MRGVARSRCHTRGTELEDEHESRLVDVAAQDGKVRTRDEVNCYYSPTQTGRLFIIPQNQLRGTLDSSDTIHEKRVLLLP